MDKDNITKSDIISELWKRGDLWYLLHSSQIEFREFVEQTKSLKIMLHAGRGWGKTTDALIEDFEFGIKNPGIRMVYAAKSRESVKQIVLPTFFMITANVPEKYRPIWKSQDHSILLHTGSVMVLEGADDDHGNKLRGAFAHRVRCDEFGFWLYPQYVANTILLPQVQRARKHFPNIAHKMKMFFMSTTPESLGHEFYSFQLECKKNNSYFLRTVEDNPLLTEAEIEEYARECPGGRTGTMFRREYMCEDVVEISRSVIPEFNPSIHVLNDSISAIKPEYYDNYTAMDLGLVDYTHVLFAYYDFNNATVVIDDEVCENYKTTNELARLIKDKESAYHKPPKIRVSDNDAQQLTDLSVEHGLTFTATEKRDKEAAINKVRNLFAAHRIKINKRCINLIHQLTVGIWNTRRTDYERLAGAGHLDGIDALIYLCRNIDYNHNPYVAQYDNQTQFINPIDRAKQSYENVFGRRI